MNFIFYSWITDIELYKFPLSESQFTFSIHYPFCVLYLLRNFDLRWIWGEVKVLEKEGWLQISRQEIIPLSFNGRFVCQRLRLMVLIVPGIVSFMYMLSEKDSTRFCRLIVTKLYFIFCIKVSYSSLLRGRISNFLVCVLT